VPIYIWMPKAIMAVGPYGRGSLSLPSEIITVSTPGLFPGVDWSVVVFRWARLASPQPLALTGSRRAKDPPNSPSPPYAIPYLLCTANRFCWPATNSSALPYPHLPKSPPPRALPASASASTDHGATSLTNGALPRTAAFPSWHPSRVSHPAKT
jgi:hypothetical protein